MWKFLIFFYLLENCVSNFQLSHKRNNSLICIVNTDDPAIFVNSTNPKAQLLTSAFQNRIVAVNFENSTQSFGSWKIISSINPQIKLKPIIDYRWENLPVTDENSNGLTLSVPNIIAFSVKLFEKKSFLNLIVNGTCIYKILIVSYEENQNYTDKICVLKSHLFNWCHFQISVNKDKIHTVSWDGQECENKIEAFREINFHLDNKLNIWKLHKYNYLWTNKIEPDNFQYSIKSNLSCIAISVAMCQKCILLIKVTDNYQKKSTYHRNVTTNRHQWKTIQICLNLTNINLTLTTTSSLLNDTFWAIDDITLTTKYDNRTLTYELQENENANCEFITPETVMKCENKSTVYCCGLCVENNIKNPENDNNYSNSNNLNYLLFLIVPLIIVIGIGVYLFSRKKPENNKEEIQKPGETTGLTTPDWLFKEPEYND